MGQSNEPTGQKERWSRAQAVREVEAFHKSGQTAQEWCAARGVTLSRLQYWRTELRGEPEREQASTGPFVPIAVREPFAVNGAPTELALVVDGRFELRSPRGFDGPTLERVLRVLAEVSPC